MKLTRPNLGRVGIGAGRGELCVIESDCLVGNALGDPHRRELPVYLPPGWDAPGAQFPALFVLAGFTGRGHKYLAPHPWFSSVAQRFDAAIVEGDAPPAVLVMPDCFTRLGGSQYVDSTATGPYETHVAQELVPLVEEHLPVLPGRRGVVGKSSGGFGALHLAMRRPGLFQAAASISGDVDFELCFGSEILAAMRGLVPHGLSPQRFLEAFARDRDLSGDGHAVINVLAMAACYSPNPESPLGFDLPMELERGERIPEVWRRWLSFDPLEAVRPHAQALRSLEYLHVECGLADEYNLQWGLRRLVRKLQELDVPHVHEEHSGGHRGTDDRYLRVLPRLASILAG
ncbi:alpha/beta hydrolase [Engelhardtia mirabilis]|uniref:Esterase n=1 Tax=Engelhardtia mirabilis TaxID=2528011 RepID=A0A518BLA4_9BACT|nr:Putative esterase [Planctomycetes bacterium Pla133]QDV02077.1 Putative esterase [Planctomycetes bacterium Pla86]